MTYLETMLNSIWEVFQRANRNGFLWRISRGSVRLGDLWNNDLSVAHSSKSSRLEKRFAVVNTAPVHVQSCIH